MLFVIYEQSDMWESNGLIHREFSPSRKRPGWYKKLSVSIRREFDRGYRYETFDTTQYFGLYTSILYTTQREFESNVDTYEREISCFSSREIMRPIK